MKGQCKLCSKTKKLIKAHMIPEWCFKHGSNPDENAIIATNDPMRRAETRSPGSVGIYDKNILCEACDGSFSEWEQHFKEEFFQKFLTFSSQEPPPLEHPIILSQGFSQEKLKLFFISLLWRASISKHSFYRRVNCGIKHETKLKEMLIKNNAGDPSEFSVWAKYYADKDKISYSKSVFIPLRCTIHKVNCYTFALLGFEFTIKSCSRPTPPTLKNAVLGETGIWPCIPKNFIGSEMQEIAIKVGQRIVTEEHARSNAKKLSGR
ncbi:MAG: hypothetical protein OXT65_07895 [Alphaproteobacteria bacterium]|nr:hypothetical protein [Alphaproteobacteria bacterium]